MYSPGTLKVAVVVVLPVDASMEGLALLKTTETKQADSHRGDLERIALVAFLRRLLDRYAGTQDHMWAETLLPKASDEELERLVEVALNVVAEEAKG